MISSLEGGGSERQALLLLEKLDRVRFAPELYLLRKTGSLLGRVPADVPIHSFAESAGADAQGWFHLPGAVHRAQISHVSDILRQRGIDVVYDRTFHMTLIAAPAAQQCGIPRVSTIVSPPSRAVPLNAGRFLAIKRRRLRSGYRSAAAVIAVSGPTARDAATYYGLSRQAFTVIPNPVDAESLDAIVAQSPRPRRDERFTIACVGRMSVEKGQVDLLKAAECLARSHPDFPMPNFWMIGDGPLRASFEHAIDSLRLRDHFEFIGHVEQPAVWVAAADAVCIPSHFEGFPNVMLEAMALGIPVIARSIDVTRSLGRLASDPAVRGRDYVATFTGSAIALADKIRRVRLNTTGTRSRVLAARRLARESLSPDKIVPKIELLLTKAMVHSGPGVTSNYNRHHDDHESNSLP